MKLTFKSLFYPGWTLSRWSGLWLTDREFTNTQSLKSNPLSYLWLTFYHSCFGPWFASFHFGILVLSSGNVDTDFAGSFSSGKNKMPLEVEGRCHEGHFWTLSCISKCTGSTYVFHVLTSREEKATRSKHTSCAKVISEETLSAQTNPELLSVPYSFSSQHCNQIKPHITFFCFAPPTCRVVWL